MALIGNYNVFNKSAGRWLAGSTVAGASNAYCRSNYNRNSDWRKFSLQERSTPSTILRLAAKPDGYGATGWALPTRAGAIAARNRSVGVAAFTGAMASGRALTGAFVGVASFSGTGALVVSGTGAFSGVAAFSGNIAAALAASGSFAATSSFSGAVVAQGFVSGAFAGSANFLATRYATGSLSGSFAPAVTLEAAGFSSYLLDEEDIETGLTLRQALRLIAAATAGKVDGGGTTTITFSNAIADDVDRIVATVDSNGNRTAITYDLE